MRHRAHIAITTLSILAALQAAPGRADTIFVPNNLGGSLGYSYRLNNTADQQSSSHYLEGTVNGSGYFWQPWMATVNGSLALNQQFAEHTNSRSSDTHLTGFINLNLLPMSTFPFSMSYKAKDNFSERESTSPVSSITTTTDSNYQTHQLTLRQSYYGDLFRLNAQYDLDNYISDTSESTSNHYGLNGSYTRPNHNLRGNIDYTLYEQANSSNENDAFVIYLNHHYHPSNNFNLNSFASYTDNTLQYFNTATTSIATTETIATQATSMLSWRTLDSRWSVNAMARAYEYETIAAGIDSERLSVDTSATLRFRPIDRLNLSAGTAISAQEGSNSSESSSITNSAGASYSSSSYNLGLISYNWSASLNASHQSHSSGSTLLSTTEALSHSINRGWGLLGGMTQFNLAQSLSMMQQDSGSESNTISHGASLNWTHGSRSSNTNFFSSVSDSRPIGSDGTGSQMLSVQLTRQQNISQRSSLNANLSAQSYRNAPTGGELGGFSHTLSANFGYKFTRPFGIQQLNFHSRINFSKGLPENGADTFRTYWDSTLKHSIGKIRSSLQYRFQDTDGKQDSMLIFRVKRMF